jgi:hypothetical protein
MIYINPSQIVLAQTFQKRLPRPIGRIQRYHAVGGANGTPMVVMFVG